MKIAVLGAGSWGTALAILLSEKGHIVRMWGHSKEHVDKLILERENKKYLNGIPFPSTLFPVHELEVAITGCRLVLVVVPSQYLRDVFTRAAKFIESGTRIVSAVKGIENTTLKTMSQVIGDLVYTKDEENSSVEIGVLSGPSFAEEVARGVPTAVTLGFKNIGTAKDLQKSIATDHFRIYASRDVIGLEISGAMKNIVAIAAGVCDGLGYGQNTRAALITRGLVEMKRLGMAMGAESATFSGLSGLGDLVLTCTGDLSRNRTVGLKLGQGKSLKEITGEMTMVAEGISNTRSIYDLAKKLEIEMPILEQIYGILYKGNKCSEAVKNLLQRELKEE